MIGTVAVVVDSASYLPADVHRKYGLLTVPMNVRIGEAEFRELETLDAATFYEKLGTGEVVATSQPSPGQFVSAYEQARLLGAQRILSIHMGSALSGTVNSARMASEMVEAPVDVVDTGQASFIEGLCAWEACERLEHGASPEEAKAAALRASEAAGNVFIVRGLELMRAGGRLKADAEGDGVPVMEMTGDGVQPAGTATTTEEAMDALVSRLETAIGQHPGKRFRVGISNGAADELAAELEQRVRKLDAVEECMQYVVGPAVGAHTGRGCTGIVYLPRPV